MPRRKPARARPARKAGRVPRNTLSRAVVVDAALAMIPLLITSGASRTFSQLNE